VADHPFASDELSSMMWVCFAVTGASLTKQYSPPIGLIICDEGLWFRNMLANILLK
jgi:hypothetical protein